MAASTARAYRNPEGGKSENPSLFSLRQAVESSTWPALYRAFLLAMLEKNRFGTELYPSQRRLARELGVSYSTARRIVDRLQDGHRFGRKNVNRCEGVLTLLIEPNMRPGGKLRRTATYQLHPQRLRSAPTNQEIEDHSRGALCPLPPRAVPTPPPTPPAPAKPQEHRGTHRETEAKPKLTSRECAKLVAEVAVLMRGVTGHVEQHSGLRINYEAGDPRHRPKMKFREALRAVCAAWKRTPESVLDAMKFWGYDLEAQENES